MKEERNEREENISILGKPCFDTQALLGNKDVAADYKCKPLFRESLGAYVVH